MLNLYKRHIHIINFRPVPFILIGIAGGILAFTRQNALLAAAYILVLAAIFVFALIFTDIKKSMIYFFAVAVILGGLVSTAVFYTYDAKLYSGNNEAIPIIARVKSVDDMDGGNIKIICDSLIADGEKVNGNAYLIYGGDEDFAIGEEVLVSGSLKVLGLDVSDSYSLSAFNDLIFYEIIPLSIEKGMSYRPKSAEKARAAILDKLDESVGDKAAGFLYSMLFGDKSRLDGDIIRSFRISGTAHVFAVSGLHVGVLLGVIVFLLKKLKLKNYAVLAAVALILAFYAYLASFSPSVIRASLMALIMLLARALGRRNDSLSTLCLTAAILLLFKPYWLFDVSFLLSFSAVFGIVMLYPPFSRVFKRFGYLGDAAALNLSVNIGILPFVLYYFQYFSLLTMPANIIMIPLVSFAYVLVLAHLFCCFLLPFFGIFGAIVKPIIIFCIDFAAKIAEVPGTIVNIEAPISLFVPYYAGVIAVSDYALIIKRAKIIAAAVLFIVFALFAMLLAH